VKSGVTIAIHLFKRLQEIVADEGADLLGAQIISIVKPLLKNVGAENDAGASLPRQNPCARPAVKFRRVGPNPRAGRKRMPSNRARFADASAVAMM